MQQVNLLPLACPSKSNFPIRQHPLQIAFRPPEGRNIGRDAGEFLLGECKDTLARSVTSVAGLQNLGELRQREADAKCPLNYLDSFDGTRRIDSIPCRAPQCLGQYSDSLVMSNRVRTHPRRPRQFAGVKSCIESLHHEEYEPWNAFQRQAIL